jgi:hypothetical protein
VTVNIFPDNIFREIFAFCLSNVSEDYWYPSSHAREWQSLVQVCQRWQQIIYGSPRYLDLHIHCSNRTPFRKNLGRWPEFPLTVNYTICPYGDGDVDVDDLIAALEQPERVHRINLTITSSDSRVYEVLEKMKVPFPALTHLDLTGPDQKYDTKHDKGVALPHDFLGESAPCLQHLLFDAICFQELPKLLLSTCGLVSLQLMDIPWIPGFYDYYGYISPEAMVGGLAGLTRLRTLCIKYRYPQDPEEGPETGRHPEPSMRGVLPALTGFEFMGESKYLEDLVARIDMPSVEDIEIEYFLSEAEVRQLSQFIGRTANLELAQFSRAKVTFNDSYSQIQLDCPQGERHQTRFSLGAEIPSSSRDPDLDVLVPRMARVLGQLTALLSNVRHLSFDRDRHLLDNRMDNSKLLPLLHLFPAVEELHVSGGLAEHIATVLENIAEERVTEVMPALRSLQLGDGNGPVGSTERFLSFRQLSGHPVAVVNNNTQDGVIQA